MPTNKGTVASGADRAGGERRRRRGTPLIAGSDAPATPAPAGTAGKTRTVKAAPAAKPATSLPAPKSTPKARKSGAAATAPKESTPSASTHRPAPKVTSGPSRKARASSGGRQTTRPTRAAIRAAAASAPKPTLRVVPDPPEGVSSSSTTTSLVPGLDDLVGAGVAALRTAAAATGLAPDEIEETVARVISYVRRRVEGRYDVDDFGFDADFTEAVALPLLRPLYRKWFRVEVRGIENLPTEGGALVVANHSGTVAVDSLMTQVAVHDETPGHRHLRMLGADLVFATPFLGTFARRSGSTLATNPDAERLLTAGELVGVWPEGFKGVGKPFSERYKLQRFGRGGFVSAALRTGVPIIPCSIVGAEEIYPMIGNLKTVARIAGMPYFPVTPTFPWLGPLGMIPLPSKWIIEFGRPVDTASLGTAAADDPMVVFDLTDQVRETIQQSLYNLLLQRRSVFS